MIHFLGAVDQSVLDFLYGLRTLPLTYFFIDVSEFGRWQLLLPFTAVLTLWFLVKGRFADTAGLVVAVLGSGAAVLALKLLIERPRPPFHYQAYGGELYPSFPSAHAALAAALYLFLAYLLTQSKSTALRRFVIGFLPILALTVAFSRLYLGVHYLSDVVTGCLIGALFFSLAIRTRLTFLGKYRGNRDHDIP